MHKNSDVCVAGCGCLCSLFVCLESPMKQALVTPFFAVDVKILLQLHVHVPKMITDISRSYCLTFYGRRALFPIPSMYVSNIYG